MKNIWALILLLVFASLAAAQDDISESTGLIGNGRYLGAKDTTNQLTVPVLGVNASGNTEVNANSSAESVLAVAKTPVAGANSSKGLKLKVTGTGYNFASPYVPTLAATPAAGTNDFKPGLNIVPTAAANAAAGLAAVPTPGETYVIFNSGPNAVRVKAYGTPGINGGASGTYIPLATKQQVTCTAESATNYNCAVDTVPTPAGP